mgnify:CR=1 FL=1
MVQQVGMHHKPAASTCPAGCATLRNGCWGHRGGWGWGVCSPHSSSSSTAPPAHQRAVTSIRSRRRRAGVAPRTRAAPVEPWLCSLPRLFEAHAALHCRRVGRGGRWEAQGGSSGGVGWGGLRGISASRDFGPGRFRPHALGTILTYSAATKQIDRVPKLPDRPQKARFGALLRAKAVLASPPRTRRAHSSLAPA